VPQIGQTKRARIYKRDGYICQDCGRRMAPDDPALTLDHHVPKAYGGTNRDTNLRTMCEPCNQAKGAAPPPGFEPPRRTAATLDGLKSRFPMDYS
jgi:5-methylcytosine-specific restriction endonuclease McrA